MNQDKWEKEFSQRFPVNKDEKYTPIGSQTKKYLKTFIRERIQEAYEQGEADGCAWGEHKAKALLTSQKQRMVEMIKGEVTKPQTSLSGFADDIIKKIGEI